MSTDYGCALGGPDHKVNWLVTRLSPALTISLCDEDFPVGLIPLLGSELGVDPARLYDAVKRFVDREQAREAKAAAAGSTETDRLDPGPEGTGPSRCGSCGRVAGMPVTPCEDCPDAAEIEES